MFFLFLFSWYTLIEWQIVGNWTLILTTAFLPFHLYNFKLSSSHIEYLIKNKGPGLIVRTHDSFQVGLLVSFFFLGICSNLGLTLLLYSHKKLMSCNSCNFLYQISIVFFKIFSLFSTFTNYSLLSSWKQSFLNIAFCMVIFHSIFAICLRFMMIF